jgi:hypothetical protein
MDAIISRGVKSEEIIPLGERVLIKTLNWRR